MFAMVAFVLVAAEVVARIYVEVQGDALQKAFRVLEPNASWGWQQRAGLDRFFFGARVQTDSLGLRVSDESKAPAKPRDVLVLGPSSTFGWGVEAAESYSGQLERLLREKVDPAYRVINAGEIGFSTVQGRVFLSKSELSKLSPEALVVAYGANDVDRFRFFFNDRQPDRVFFEKGASPVAVAVDGFVGRSVLFELFRRKVLGSLLRFNCAAFGPPTVRVDEADFKEALEGFVAYARERHIPVIFVSTASRYPKGKLADAAANEARYRLSAAQARAGQCQKAFEYFNEARKTEPQRLGRDLARYNGLLRDFARRQEAGFVDAAGLLDADAANFVDPIHPSTAGHRLIAQALYSAILSKDVRSARK